MARAAGKENEGQLSPEKIRFHESLNRKFSMRLAAAKPKIFLGPELNCALMTPEEFDAVEEYDENYRYELIHGVLIVNPPPLPAETGSNEELRYWLKNYKELYPRGQQ